MPKIENNGGKPLWFKVKKWRLLYQYALKTLTTMVIHRHWITMEYINSRRFLSKSNVIRVPYIGRKIELWNNILHLYILKTFIGSIIPHLRQVLLMGCTMSMALRNWTWYVSYDVDFFETIDVVWILQCRFDNKNGRSSLLTTSMFKINWHAILVSTSLF